MDVNVISILREKYIIMSDVYSPLSEEFKKKYDIDIANYLMNLMYMFDLLNTDTLNIIEQIQGAKLYSLSQIKASSDFEKSIPFFVSGGISFIKNCMSFNSNMGQQVLEMYKSIFEEQMIFYEVLGSRLLSSLLNGSGTNFNSLLSYYNHIRNAESIWNDFLTENNSALHKPIRFSMLLGTKSLDEFIEETLDD